MAYWCNFENQTIFIGKKGNKPLEIRKIRLPEDRIEIYDGKEGSESFLDILDKLPHLSNLYDLNKVNYPEFLEINKNMARGVDRPEDDFMFLITE